LLAKGERAWAERWFLQAIWADPDLADAWFGYALVRDSSADAMAVAVLLYPDRERAQSRLDATIREVFPDIPVMRNELQSRFDRSVAKADALRWRLSSGTLPHDRPQPATR
ncbi:MAG: hypothetical protein ACREO3_08895, partial [Arenimonas sp.]